MPDATLVVLGAIEGPDSGLTLAVREALRLGLGDEPNIRLTLPPVLEEHGPDNLAACWVTMDRARKEMGADELVDIRPGAGSGVHKGQVK